MTDNWAIFLSFYPTNDKKRLEIPSFNSNVSKIMIICYTVPEIWRMKDLIYIFHLGFLPFYTPNGPKNQNFFKNGKNTWRHHHFTCVPKIIIRWCTVPENGARQTDGWTDGRKKWHMEMGAPPKNNTNR